MIPESFRHSYCRTMLLKEMPQPVLEKLMGHGSDRMIRLHYGKIESPACERGGDAVPEGRRRIVAPAGDGSSEAAAPG